MATFPRPLCELRVLLGHRDSRRSRPNGTGAKITEARQKALPFDACTPTCTPESDKTGDADCGSES